MVIQQTTQETGRALRPAVSPAWLTAIKEHEPLVRHLIVEQSPRPARTGTDLYLCGECGIALARRPAGASLGHALIHCPNCMTLNEP